MRHGRNRYDPEESYRNDKAELARLKLDWVKHLEDMDARQRDRSLWRNPLLYALIGTAATVVLSTWSTNQIERNKAALEATLELKGLGPREQREAAQFLVASGAITGELKAFLEKRLEEIPPGKGLFAPISANDPRAADIREFHGTCDVSAGAALGADSFVAASDEDNVLRAYRTGEAQPFAAIDLTEVLGIEPGRGREVDIEGATALATERSGGPRIFFFIGSHGTSRERAEERPNRRMIFAVRAAFSRDGRTMTFELVGKPYTMLASDLAALPALELGSAADQPPSVGLNIEGLAASPDGTELYVGFRSPTVRGDALIVPLRNPLRMLAGERASLGEPITLNLGGRGISAMEYVPPWRSYVIVAAPRQQGVGHAAFVWSGRRTDGPTPLDELELAGLKPEGLIWQGTKSRLIVLSDDGDRPLRVNYDEATDIECGDLSIERQRFRALAFDF